MQSPTEGPRPPRMPLSSTFVVGAIVVLAVVAGAASGGTGGVLIALAVTAAMTGLYVLATGRRSWAWLPGRRRAGAIVLAGSLALFVAGAVSLPKADSADLAASPSRNQGATDSPATPDAPNATQPAPPRPTETESGSPLDGPAPTTSDAAGVKTTRPASVEGPFPVTSVTDGDTIRVGIGGTSTRIRLIGIDTPEVTDPRKPVQCFGREASQRAHTLMDGTQVWLEYDPSQGRRDRYGRTLAYVWLNEFVLVNEEMVSEGFAHEYTYNNPYKYRDAFRAGEQAARNAQRGLWNPNTCAGNTDRPAG